MVPSTLIYRDKDFDTVFRSPSEGVCLEVEQAVDIELCTSIMWLVKERAVNWSWVGNALFWRNLLGRNNFLWDLAFNQMRELKAIINLMVSSFFLSKLKIWDKNKYMEQSSETESRHYCWRGSFQPVRPESGMAWGTAWYWAAISTGSSTTQGQFWPWSARASLTTTVHTKLMCCEAIQIEKRGEEREDGFSCLKLWISVCSSAFSKLNWVKKYTDYIWTHWEKCWENIWNRFSQNSLGFQAVLLLVMRN